MNYTWDSFMELVKNNLFAIMLTFVSTVYTVASYYYSVFKEKDNKKCACKNFACKNYENYEAKGTKLTAKSSLKNKPFLKKTIIPLVISFSFCAWCMLSYSKSTPVFLTSLRVSGQERYEGNFGDSCFKKLDNNTKQGLKGEIFDNGLEGWIARFTTEDETSWASITYDLSSDYNELRGRVGLIESYNTDNFDTTLYFLGDDDIIIESIDLKPNFAARSFTLKVENVNKLTIKLQDNKASRGGTSFALYDLILS